MVDKLVNILRQRSRIIQHIFDQLDNSMIGYQVNGNPTQRKYTLLNIARYIFSQMNSHKKRDIIDRLDQQ